MAQSFTTFSFPSQTQRPLTFKPYEPKMIHKSARTRGIGVSGDSRAFEVSSVDSVTADGIRETADTSDSVLRGLVTATVEDACFETQGETGQVESERGATVGPVADDRLLTSAGEEIATQGHLQQRKGLSSAQQSSASQQSSPSPRLMEGNDAEYDHLVNDLIGTHDPPLSQRSSKRKCDRSLSQSDLDADISDATSANTSSRQFGKRRKCSLSERSVESSPLLSDVQKPSTPAGTVQEQGSCTSGEEDHLLGQGEPSFFTPNGRARRRGKNRSSVGALTSGAFAHRRRLQDRTTEASQQDTSNLRTLRRRSRIQPAIQRPRRTRNSGIKSRLGESTSRCTVPESSTHELFGRAMCGPLIPKSSGTSRTSLSCEAVTQDRSAVDLLRAEGTVGREMCIQPISPGLSLLFYVVPDLGSVQALIHPQDGHGGTANLECPGALENVIVKQLGPTMWLVAGTLQIGPKICSPSTQPEDGVSDRERESASADEDTSSLSGDESEEQFSAKNQRWSEEDDHLLCQWVKAGKPWWWVFSQFPMRTPGSVRTRYSVLRRKTARS